MIPEHQRDFEEEEENSNKVDQDRSVYSIERCHRYLKNAFTKIGPTGYYGHLTANYEWYSNEGGHLNKLTMVQEKKKKKNKRGGGNGSGSSGGGDTRYELPIYVIRTEYLQQDTEIIDYLMGGTGNLTQHLQKGTEERHVKIQKNINTNRTVGQQESS